MLRFREMQWRGACLLLAASPIAACATAPRPTPLPAHGANHQFIAQAATGFVIRAAGTEVPANAAPSSAPVTLGNTVRIDRDALISNHPKEVSHGENR